MDRLAHAPAAATGKEERSSHVVPLRLEAVPATFEALLRMLEESVRARRTAAAAEGEGTSSGLLSTLRLLQIQLQHVSSQRHLPGFNEALVKASSPRSHPKPSTPVDPT